MSHRLNVAVTEWRVLAAVQPLFAEPVPWDLATPIDATNSDIAAPANAITIDKLKEVFANEMGEMRINLMDLSNLNLKQQSYRKCRYKIKSLLLLLETLVLEQVLHHPDAREQDLNPLVEEQDENGKASQSVSFTPEDKERVWSWLAPESPIPDSMKTPTTIYTLPKTLAACKASKKEPYQKLEALGRIVAKRLSQGRDLVENCKVFLDLHCGLNSFENLKARAMKVNGVVRGLPQQLSLAGSRASGTQEFSRTNWESRKATDFSDRLYYHLVEAICDQSPPHKAELQLDGFKLDESCTKNSLVQGLFLSCPTGDGWRQCRCASVLRNSAIRSHVVLSDICGSIRLSKSQVFSIEFDEEDLLYNKFNPQSPVYADDFRVLTLGYLLEHGFFGKDRDGDIFSLNDKAVLALSLARSLVHLWHGMWTRGPWTADTIRFLHTTNEILDRHSPYVNCDLESTRDELKPFKPTLGDLQLSVLGFAQLLVEIETGERIHLDVASGSLEDFKDCIEAVMDSRKNEFGRGDYNTAVQKCLQFKALLRRELQNGEEDLLSLSRNILYTNIIEPLEKNFNQIPDPAAARMSRPLKIQGHTITPAPISSISEVTSTNTSLATFRRRYTPKRDFATAFYYNDAQKPAQHDIDVMFFDEESTARKENGRPRVRIAVLDTGVDQGNEDFRGLVDEIKDARKKQKLPRTDQNPIKKIESFIGDDGVDNFGHGTHVAGLVLQTAPDADLYIAKVSCGKSFQNTEAVVQAVDWAIKNEVDIINMSFGSEFDDINVADALDRACNAKRKKTILLAAASNNGRNSKRTFPARHEGVIAIHSLDGKGNDEGGMNPSRKGYFENFGTLGLGIKTLWDRLPPHLESSVDAWTTTATTKYKSGSSYATPIAAGIVANCIEWIDYMWARGSLNTHQYASLRKPKGIRLMLKKQSEVVGDILSVAPWILWREDHSDPMNDGEAPRRVDEKADNHVLELLLEELHPVKPE
ncbi:hypothetical protein FHL15_004930 [Xylaria flabelliformis]|uniref:Uncharacterized protein n=1 Tax=Xylaria flabelliformis TaxID=2512241 RepID=A0A553I1U1_9PEZI|nr:hypothetical protein FHL15_004930 [Xylaria flabelliformis]